LEARGDGVAEELTDAAILLAAGRNYGPDAFRIACSVWLFVGSTLGIIRKRK
jgi:hypothetical protein